MRRVVVLVLLLGLMTLLQALQVGTVTSSDALSLATFGFVLLAAYTLGQVSASAGLPKITGYIVTGLVFGPQILNVFSTTVTDDLSIVNDLAIGLIAFGAGAEMHLANLKKIARSLVLIIVIKGALILAAITAAVWALSPHLPFLSDQPLPLVLSVGLILGVLAIGTSPAATIAVISETGAKGRLADTTLGVAVGKDIVMVILLAVAIALAGTFLPGGHGFEPEILVDLGKELGLSLLAGLVLGAVVILYMKYVGAELWLFLVAVVFGMTAIAHQFHLEALLTFIVGGFVVQNGSKLGHDFAHLVETVALPVFVVFFCAAGAGIDLGALRSVGLVAVALVLVRLAAIWLGTGLATRLAGEPAEVRKNAWLAFVAQAGVVIGLLILVEEKLPGIGSDIRTLVMGTVAIHLLLGPILFKVALTRAGEIPRPADEGATADPLAETRATSISQAPLAEELEIVASEAEQRVLAAVDRLGDAARQGPLRVAEAVERGEFDTFDDTAWALDFEIAAQELWHDINSMALDVQRHIRVPLEAHWFETARHDLASERWRKRGRRLVRAVKKATGSDGRLYRAVPFRNVTLYHLDQLLPEDLQTSLATIAAQPAFALRSAFALETPEEQDQEAPPDDSPISDDPLAVLRAAVEKRFSEFRSDLTQVGTGELPSRKRRPSHLHEGSKRAKERTSKAIRAWGDLATSVIAHRERRHAIAGLREQLTSAFDAFDPEFEGRFNEDVTAPLERARDVLTEAVNRAESLPNELGDDLERGVIRIGEWTSVELRRQTLAGLRRDLEARPFNQLLEEFDERLVALLRDLPQHFRVADPNKLPDPSRSPRSYVKPAQYEFQLIAESVVERTVGPSFDAMTENSAAALEMAETTAREVRESIELRFESALDAAMDARRDLHASVAPGEDRRVTSQEIVSATLTDAIKRIEVALNTAEETRSKILDQFRVDSKALEDGLDTRLAGAGVLETRLQAERARVELRGAEFVRDLVVRAGAIRDSLLARVGLVRPSEDDDGTQHADGADLGPAGAPGTDRAVLFRVLFDTKTVGGRVFDRVLITVILASVLVVVLDSVTAISERLGTPFLLLEWLFTIVFTAEYVGRLWSVNRPWKYALSFFGIVDFIALAPAYLMVFIPGGQSFVAIRVLRIARVFRVFKLARYGGAASVLSNALVASRFKIIVFLAGVVVVAVVAGSAMFVVEGPATGFTSIPRSVYWSIVTLTTVGYGDISPGTPLGQMLAAMLMILGYGIIAVPTGIVSAEMARGPSHAVASGGNCRSCGHGISDPAARFCPSCGVSLTQASGD